MCIFCDKVIKLAMDPTSKYTHGFANLTALCFLGTDGYNSFPCKPSVAKYINNILIWGHTSFISRFNYSHYFLEHPKFCGDFSAEMV